VGAYRCVFLPFSSVFRSYDEIHVSPGCLATCGALAISAAKFRAGKSSDVNFWLRARVVLQGLTLNALLAGSMSIQEVQKEELARLNIGQDIEATTEPARKKEKEKLEFEERRRRRLRWRKVLLGGL